MAHRSQLRREGLLGIAVSLLEYSLQIGILGNFFGFAGWGAETQRMGVMSCHVMFI